MIKTLKMAAVFVLAAIVVSFVPKQEPLEELKWETWNEGYVKVTSGEKIGLIDVYTDWCGWCKRMDRDTYSNKTVIDKINKKFVPIKFNPEKQGVYYIDSVAYSGPQLYAMLSNNNPSGFPTTFFLIRKGDMIHIQRVEGYQGAEDFSVTLDNMAKEN